MSWRDVSAVLPRRGTDPGTWEVEHIRLGDLTRFDNEELAEGGKWASDADAFVNALTTVGLIDADRKLHDWNDHGTRILDQSRERMAVLRFKHRNRDVTVTTATEGKKEREREGKKEGKKETKDVRAALLHFGVGYKAVVADTYPCAWQKDYTLMARVVQQYGEVKVLDLIDLFFETSQQAGAWHSDKLTVGVFVTQLSRLVQLLAKEREARTPQ